jgi:heme exporter protein D
MYFQTFTQLWQMEGHGPYVWSAYLIVVLAMLVLVGRPLRRQRRTLVRVRSRLRAMRTTPRSAPRDGV